MELSPKELEFARQWIERRRQQSSDERRRQLQALQLGLQQVQAQMSSLTDLLLKGTVDETVYREKQNTLLLRQTDLRQKLNDLDGELDRTMGKLASSVELAKSPSLLYKTASREKKRELLKILLSNLAVSGKNVEITLAIPFRMIADRGNDDECGPYRETCRTWREILRKLLSFFATNTQLES